VKAFGALMNFFYTGTMNFSVTDCFYLFLAHPIFYRVTVDADLLVLHWRKRLSSLGPAETKELEAVLMTLDKDNLVAFNASDLQSILSPSLIAAAVPSTPRAHTISGAAPAGAAAASPSIPRSAFQSSPPTPAAAAPQPMVLPRFYVITIFRKVPPSLNALLITIDR
jgi:hypothetical protein